MPNLLCIHASNDAGRDGFFLTLILPIYLGVMLVLGLGNKF
jgi:hypothetical protein